MPVQPNVVLEPAAREVAEATSKPPLLYQLDYPAARKVLEVERERLLEELAAERKQLVIPADPEEVAKLAPKYKSAELGDIAVKKAGASTVFDMGEWKAEVASRKNADGTVSFAIISPELQGLDFIVGKSAAGKPTLILRDAQHEYVFDGQ